VAARVRLSGIQSADADHEIKCEQPARGVDPTLPPGANEATPLAHDGDMFVHGFGDSIQALDAATGDLLWQYSRELPKRLNPGVKRIAIYGNKAYLGTSDVHVVALDAKTGKVAWDQALTTDKGFRLSGGPLVAKDKVMIGTGGRVAGGNCIVALDAETGKEAWRFKTHRAAR
jgi:alcohol dehydrogenase (cytochrome c)